MAWKLKQKPSDFTVREEVHDSVEESWKEKMSLIRGIPSHGTARGGGRGVAGGSSAAAEAGGSEPARKYLWMTMRKEDADFFTAIGTVARALSVSSRDVGYAGTKDRRAITFQTISVPADKEKEARTLRLPGLSFSDMRRRARPVKLGEHEGNSFGITVRNVGKSERARTEGRLKRMKTDGFLNFYGEQRFGSVSGRNAKIGKMLVLGNIEEAVKMLVDGKLARGTPEYAMKAYLSKNPEDFSGALRLAPLRMVKLFVHAYQALLWNRAAQEYAKAHAGKPPGGTRIPVVGYATDLRCHPKARSIIEGIMEREKIDAGDFRNKAFRELSSRGSERDLVALPKGLSWEFAEDEDNPGKLKLTLSFFLHKGSYATELVRQLEAAAVPIDNHRRKS